MRQNGYSIQMGTLQSVSTGFGRGITCVRKQKKEMDVERRSQDMQWMQEWLSSLLIYHGGDHIDSSYSKPITQHCTLQ